MSVRDEMARATAEAMEAWAAMNRIDEPAQTVEQWIADALLPIVERVADEAVAAHRANQVAMQATINAHESEIFDLKNQLRRANERMEALQRMFLGA